MTDFAEIAQAIDDMIREAKCKKLPLSKKGVSELEKISTSLRNALELARWWCRQTVDKMTKEALK